MFKGSSRGGKTTLIIINTLDVLKKTCLIISLHLYVYYILSEKNIHYTRWYWHNTLWLVQLNNEANPLATAAEKLFLFYFFFFTSDTCTCRAPLARRSAPYRPRAFLSFRLHRSRSQQPPPPLYHSLSGWPLAITPDSFRPGETDVLFVVTGGAVPV